MPELPEVETIRRDLEQTLVGRTIEAITIHRDDILRQTEPRELREAVAGRACRSVRRRGKNLILWLSGGAALLVHLGMSGQLYFTDGPEEPPDHTHVVVELSGEGRVVFRDVRRFGHMELVPSGRVADSSTLRNVGIDAMSDEFSADYLAQMLAGRSALLKGALLDQSRLAGLGNIYVCEALYRAGIHPEARCNDLSGGDVRRLHAAIHAVLAEAIAAEGTTISDYVTGNGVPGSFQDRLRVYGREGEPCGRDGCEHTIERIVQSNRSTYFCPGCQRRCRAR